jgi:hypothetical protein
VKPHPQQQQQRITCGIADAGQLIDITRWSIGQLLRDGSLTGRKFGKRTLIDYASLKAFIESLEPAKFEPHEPCQAGEAAQ